ncbi:MAG: hypothetical protein ACOVOV_02880 [Dolichospermum sp.]
MADYIITNADLRTAITDAGIEGITVSPTTYPDAESCNEAVKNFLDALELAQATQNETSAAGADVSMIASGVGVATEVEYPPGSGTTYLAQPVARSVTYSQVQEVTTFIPILV